MFHGKNVLLAVAVLGALPVFAGECEPTPAMSAGTHYKPITLQRVDIGSGLLVQGKVLSAADCSPVAGAKIAHWQANKQGVYVDELRAYLLSDKHGGYRFHTEWPAAFVPHIHFRVSASGYRPLTTQWVGDEVVDAVRFDIVLEPE